MEKQNAKNRQILKKMEVFLLSYGKPYYKYIVNTRVRAENPERDPSVYENNIWKKWFYRLERKRDETTGRKNSILPHIIHKNPFHGKYRPKMEKQN